MTFVPVPRWRPAVDLQHAQQTALGVAQSLRELRLPAEGSLVVTIIMRCTFGKVRHICRKSKGLIPG